MAGGGAQQQAFGGGGGTLQVEQRRSYYVLAEIAGGNSHMALAKGAGGAGAFWQLLIVLGKSPTGSGVSRSI
ncbi:hypothetical protein Pres01_44280 [Metapseudomonas resinovorans]|nr:hypothetical protein Pres01_44280 [Pseudomonas resinovorans]